MKLQKYSFGIGDRFGHQGEAQLRAIMKAASLGIELVPVWNKSFREHQIIGTQPQSVRLEADQAVEKLQYKGAYYVDADHITADTVDRFIPSSDFFTLDVARYIGSDSSDRNMVNETPLVKKEEAVARIRDLGTEVMIESLKDPILLNPLVIERFVKTYFTAVQEAASLYRYLADKKGSVHFVTEVSMDEVEHPQSPTDLFLILFLLSLHEVPVQTIAPKFSGRFNKGVDYVGHVSLFRQEFEADLLIIRHAVRYFGLPDNLKLSIHSGSDKFGIYPVIGELIRKYDMGIHVKTAGTTWLEEVIGLALGDDDSLGFVKGLYRNARLRMTELCGPYADVIDIDLSKLPQSIDQYSSQEIAALIRHVPHNPQFNNSVRQLMHVAYKLAAEAGEQYTSLLRKHANIIGQQVEENIFERHIRKLFTAET